MELKDSIYKQINTPAIRLALAVTLRKTENTIRVYIRDKSSNLTKAAALNVISQQLKIPVSKLLKDSDAVLIPG